MQNPFMYFRATTYGKKKNRGDKKKQRKINTDKAVG
jgi:hypothetical protein